MKIPFSPPDIGEAEIEEVVAALKSGWITTGPKTKELERQVAQFCHTSKAVCLNSATAALELTLHQLGIGPGDEVITCAYTYTASASVVCHVGAKLVLVDCQKDGYQMDYDALEAAITEKTKAVIPVDIAGVICDYDRIFEIVEKKKALFTPSDNKIQQALGRVAVVADAAHAFGARRHGKCAAKSLTLLHFPSMLLRTLPQQKAEQLSGETSTELITRKSIKITCSFPCMDSPRMLWQKHSWVHGNMIS